MRTIELALYNQGYLKLVGVDEVGRGPLAGPVVAAAVYLPSDVEIPGLADSKSLSPRKREAAFYEILRHGHASIGVATSAEIDRVNILNATFLAMGRAIQGLGFKPDYCLVDGNRIIPGFTVPQEAIVKGDAKCRLIAAASIVAKVIRDRFMEDCHNAYPEYGFDRHKGYPTAQHRQAILEHGLCSIHRFLLRI